MWTNFEQSTTEDVTISNAFSSGGIFKIRSENKVKENPNVMAIVQNKRMVLAIDKNLFLLEDEMAAQCSFLNFDAIIDAFVISSTSNLVICCLRNGDIHGIFIKGLHVFNVSIRTDDIADCDINTNTFVRIQELNGRFHIICTNGSVYNLSTINESPFEAYLSTQSNGNLEGETSMEENILGEIKIDCLVKGFGTRTNTTAAVMLANGDNELPLIIAGRQNSLHFQYTQEELTTIAIPDCYGGVKQLINLENLILLLTHSGHLIEVCPVTKEVSLQRKQTGELLIDNLIIMECNNDKIELLILTKPESKDIKCRYLKMVTYPSMKCYSELEVPHHTWLVEQPKCSVNLYYLYGGQLNVDQNPTEIEMMLASETDPADRFMKLITKGHLDEAEEYGKQFELSLQPIFEARTKRLLIKLSHLNDNNPESLNENFAELLTHMNKIERNQFFKDNRSIPMQSRKILRKYLEEIVKKLNAETDENDFLEVAEHLHRLNTLDLIDPYECNVDWQKFIYHSNLLQIIIPMLKTNFSTACLVWKRHSSSIIPRLTDQELCLILKKLPADPDVFNLIQWLREYVPIAIGTHPNIMPYITEWVILKTQALQYCENWPDIGLEFFSKVMDIFKKVQFMHSDLRRQYERNIDKLNELLSALEHLCVLKESYNLIITLDNYLQDSINDTAICILQRVHLDNLRSMVNDFLVPIYRKQGQTPVVALRKYISMLVTNRNILSIWLDRAIVCIELLHNEDDRLQSALEILQHSPVPWSETVAPLVKLRHTTHPLANEINTLYEIQVIKILKTKYGWPADSGANNLNLFMHLIVKMDLADMMEDLQILTKAAPQITVGAYFNCFYTLTRNGKVDKAFDFFKTFNTKENAKHVSQIIDLFADILEAQKVIETEDTEQIEKVQHIFEFYRLIAPRESESRLVIEQRFVLQQKFNLSLPSIQKLKSPAQRLEFLEQGVDNIIQRSQTVTNITYFICIEMKALCNALELSWLQGIYLIVRKMKCLPLSCSLTYNILEYVDNAPASSSSSANVLLADDYQINLALELIVQQMQLTSSQQAVNGEEAHINQNDSLALLLAYELLSCVYIGKTPQPFNLLEVLKYLFLVQCVYPSNILDTMYNGRDTEINDKIKQYLEYSHSKRVGDGDCSFEVKSSPQKRASLSVFDQTNTEPTSHTNLPNNHVSNAEQDAVVNLVSRTLLLLLTNASVKNDFFIRMRNSLPETMRNDTTGAKQDFNRSLQQVIKMKNHDQWYTLAQYVLDYQDKNLTENDFYLARNFVSNQLRRVFRHILLQKDVNFIELFAMLIRDSQPKEFLQQLETEMRSDQQKLNLRTLSETFYRYLHNTTEAETIRAKRMKHFYYIEFCKQDPMIKGKFNPDVDDIDKLLELFHSKKLDVDLLKRISSDFQLNYEHLLASQLVSILKGQELQYEAKRNNYSDEELVVFNSVDQMRALCQPYLNEITDLDLLSSMLSQFIPKINLYFYELYLCVIDILIYTGRAPKEMKIWNNILHFLKHKMVTRRRNRPGQMETDTWLQSQTELSVLPKIARYRVPFKPIVEQPLKDILDDELSVDNCESWFPLLQMHTLLKGSTDVTKTRDYFCMSAVKNSICEYKVKDASEIWHLQPTNNAFLKSIERLVQHVSNPSKAFMILYFVANYAPEGADQVEASYECFKYATEHQQSILGTKSEEQFVKIRRKYPTLKTQHILYVFGLTDEKLMRLVEDPTELIRNLYHHEVVLKSVKPDINQMAKEIALLHSLDIEVIQVQLIQNWLSVASDTSDVTLLDETFYDENVLNEPTNIDNTTSATENVLRANYILNSWPKKKAMQFLIAHIFRESTNTAKQLQMFECFSKLDDGDSTYSNMVNQKQYIAIKCVHELKQIGFNTSVEKFAASNKIHIVKTIWQHYAPHTPPTLSLLANICLGYDINVAIIWNGILKKMVQLKMLNELNALVDILSCNCKLLQTEGLAAAWQFVLLQPFGKVNQTRTLEQDETLHRALVRLQSCPIVQKLNLIEFGELCMMLDKPHIAAILLGFSKNLDERKKLKQLVDKKRPKASELRKDIIELEDAGILPIILNVVLKEFDL